MYNVQNARVYNRTKTAYGRDFKGITAGRFFSLVFFRCSFNRQSLAGRNGILLAGEHSRPPPPAHLLTPARVYIPPRPTPPGPEMNVFRIKPPLRAAPPKVRVEFVAIEKYYIHTHT